MLSHDRQRAEERTLDFLPLARILGDGRPLDGPVALSADRALSRADLLQGAAAAAEHALSRGPGRWLLAREDAWGFATGLFGLLRAGCSVVIPPNFLPATLARMAPDLDGVLAAPETGPAGPPGVPFPDPLPDGIVEFWTSGSTGEAKRVVKRLSQLDAEVRMLETAFGSRFKGGPVVGTVPPHHIYGCLFRILWPLAAGRPFLLDPGLEGILRHAPGAGAAAPALVSSPALLSRLPRLADLDGRPPLAAVAFSSGGPLDREDALAWRRWVPGGVVEIYGSTETGGIAWRNQGEAPDTAHWTPFPDVEIAIEPGGALRLRSLRAGPGPQLMQDAAEAAPGGRFRLMGRLDRIVKLEEKRISLPELESALAGHPWVREAALVLLEGRRPALGAVVALAAQAQALARTDRRRLVQELQRHLAGRFEAIAVPKRWRFLDLPFDDRGKLTAARLAGLFGRAAASEPAPPNPPPVLGHASGAEEVFRLGLDPGLLAFQGHFPGDPILPGVIQVDWAIRLGREAFGALGPFGGVARLKFLAPVRPGEDLELSLSLDPGRERMDFRYHVAAVLKSSGTVVFGPPGGPPTESGR